MMDHNELKPYWMPFTANKAFKKNPRLLCEADGIYFKDQNQNPILDASSGLFCTPLGHNRKDLKEAITKQLDQLDYAPPFQLGHPNAFKLAQEIAKLTPDPLNQIFYSCSGSEAVDTALKLSLAYHQAKGEGQRHIFVGRQRAYHGMNFGGISVGGLLNNRKTYMSSTLPHVHHLRHTHLEEHQFVQGQPETGGLDLANDLQQIIQLCGGENIAACIVEPVAGSTGVLVPPVGYLERLRTLCDQHGILLIFDEVITGFGRLGKAFAAQAFNVTPDIITMAKALTNGVLPLGAVASRDDIYQTVTEAVGEKAIEFCHGYTFAGCPSATAVALASLKAYEEEKLFERSHELSSYFQRGLFSLKGGKKVQNIRGYGLMGAIDVTPIPQKPGAAGFSAFQELFDKGILTKATGDAILVAPPFVASTQELDEIIEKLQDVLL